MKSLLFALCAVFGAAALNVAAAVPALRVSWKSMNKAELAIGADDTVRVTANGTTSGVTANVRVQPNIRYTFSGEIRGEGIISNGINGSFGWQYGPKLTLAQDWQPVTISYASASDSVSWSVFSAGATQAKFELRKMEITPEAAVELEGDDISAKLFIAAEFPGAPAKTVPCASAPGGKAQWGRRWYNLVRVPVPGNSRPLYYYFHASKDLAAEPQLWLRRFPGSQAVSDKVKYSAPAGDWRWVRLGPVNAAIAAPELMLSFDGDAKVALTVDKVVVSTNPALDDVALNQAE